MFVKYGDGKIVSVFDEKDLTDEQKKTAKKSLEDQKQAEANKPNSSENN